MKRLVSVTLCALLLPALFAQAAEDDASAEAVASAADAAAYTDSSGDDTVDNDDSTIADLAFSDDDAFDDLDDIFFGAEDTDAVINAPSQAEGLATTLTVGDVAIPLRLSGSLTSSLGYGQQRTDDDITNSGYFDFYNYLYLYARPDTYLTVRASIVTNFPKERELPILSFQELYFDYLVCDKIYVTAGKKGTTWGYTRLFTTDFDEAKKAEYDESNAKIIGGFSTNVLSDSIEAISCMLRIPFWTGMFSAIALYKGDGSSMDMEDMSYAASIEVTVWKTAINLFGRKNPNESRYTSATISSHLMGFEVKRTVLGADVYVQEIAQFPSIRNMKHLFFEHDKTVFSSHLVTAGLYRWWDKHDPNIGFNIEGQLEYLPATNEYFRRVAFDGGLRRIGPKKNIKIGFAWVHNVDSGIGYVKPGISVANVLPHADWSTGLQIEYGSDDYKTKYTFGTYLKISTSY